MWALEVATTWLNVLEENPIPDLEQQVGLGDAVLLEPDLPRTGLGELVALLAAAGDDDGLDLGVLEADALHGVRELDVDAQVIAVHLQRVVAEAFVLLHVHGEGGDVARQPNAVETVPRVVQQQRCSQILRARAEEPSQS